MAASGKSDEENEGDGVDDEIEDTKDPGEPQGLIEMSDELDKKVAGRQRRVVLGYRLAASGYLLSLLSTTTLPLTPFSVQLAQGPIMAGSICFVLSGAAKAGRLGSDTYKRLNLGIIVYSAISLAMMALQSSLIVSPYVLFITVLTFINAVKGYGYGVLGFDKKSGDSTIAADLKSGVQSTMKGLFSVKNKRSAIYLALTYFSIALLAYMEFRLVESLRLPVTESFPRNAKKLGVARRLSALKQFKLLSVVSYTLKDAADRKRLKGSTFVNLGYVAASFLGSLAVLATPKQGVTALGVSSSAFFFWTFFNAVSSSFAKRFESKDNSG